MLSHKGKYFKSQNEYDEFSIFFSNVILMRYRDKRQFGSNPSLTKLKSVLNYMKRIVYPIKVQF